MRELVDWPSGPINQLKVPTHQRRAKCLWFSKLLQNKGLCRKTSGFQETQEGVSTESPPLRLLFIVAINLYATTTYIHHFCLIWPLCQNCAKTGLLLLHGPSTNSGFQASLPDTCRQNLKGYVINDGIDWVTMVGYYYI